MPLSSNCLRLWLLAAALAATHVPGSIGDVFARSMLPKMSSLRKRQQEEDDMREEIQALAKEAETNHRTALEEGATAGHRPLFMLPILHHFRAASSPPSPTTINGTFVDCTFGRGGHARTLLKHFSSASKLIALDVDQQAVDVASTMAASDKRMIVFKKSYGDLKSILGQTEVNGVLINSGITTDAKNDERRGIRKGPLDLRYDMQAGIPCSEWLANQTFQKLSKAIEDFSRFDEWTCMRIAHEVLCEQNALGGRFTQISQLAKAVRRVLPPTEEFGRKNDYGPKSVLAVLRRIINQEFKELQKALDGSFQQLTMGGRCLVICQSTIDRNVIRRFMRQNEEPGATASIKMDKRRLKKLYPLAGRPTLCGSLSRFDQVVDP